MGKSTAVIPLGDLGKTLQKAVVFSVDFSGANCGFKQ